MTTTTSMGTYLQKIRTNWKEKYNDMNGKIGFSRLINEKHSVGAYYRNGWNRHNMSCETPAEVWQNGALIENIAIGMDNLFSAVPMHSANVYYNGSVDKLGIDFNADYLWSKSTSISRNIEAAEIGANRDVNTSSADCNSMLAEKLVFTYPFWKGQIEVGEEYINTRTTNLFTAKVV